MALSLLFVGIDVSKSSLDVWIESQRSSEAFGNDPDGWTALIGRLAALGAIAGAPAILGAFIGASITNAELSTFLLGVGVGAIVQVIVQIWPSIRDESGRGLYPASVIAIVAGAALLYVTGLLISV